MLPLSLPEGLSTASAEAKEGKENDYADYQSKGEEDDGRGVGDHFG